MYFMNKVYRMLRRVNNHNRREIMREDDKPYSHFASIFCSKLVHTREPRLQHLFKFSTKKIPHARIESTKEGVTSCRR